jgi:hypothetical protein
MKKPNGQGIVVSPYMRNTWQKVMAERGWVATDLAEAAEKLSHNFVRRVVNGKLVPGREALQKLCSATGLDFVETYRNLRREQAELDIPVEPTEPVTVPKLKIAYAPHITLAPEGEGSFGTMERRLIENFRLLSFEGKLKLHETALLMAHGRDTVYRHNDDPKRLEPTLSILTPTIPSPDPTERS